MATIEDVIEMFAGLRAAGLAGGPVMVTEAQIIATAQVWADLLDDIDGNEIKIAAKKHAKKSDFFPKPAEIRRLCPAVERKQVEQAAAEHKNTGAEWPALIAKHYTNFSPTSSNAMVKTEMGYYQVDRHSAKRGRDRLIQHLSKGDPMIAAAMLAGIEAIGWDSWASDGWKYKEKVFAAAYQASFRLSESDQKMIEQVEKHRIACNEIPF